jgi:hypothetical protein
MRKMLLMLCALALTACVRTARDPATGNVDVDVESPTKTGEDWSARLSGMGTYSMVSGTATAKVAEGRTDATVTLTGGTPGQVHPWAIHEGKCSAMGMMVGTMSAYPDITVGANGNGQANVQLNARLDEAKDYSVAVHASHANMATIIACGDLDD